MCSQWLWERHAHQNWAFTAPGVYKVDVQASGTLVGASEAIQSEVATFTFYLDAASGSLTITHAADGQATLPGMPAQVSPTNWKVRILCLGKIGCQKENP